MTSTKYRPQSWGRPTLRNVVRSPFAPRARPQLTPATLTRTGDRDGTARLDTGSSVEVRLPDVLWLRVGDRVMLYLYPDGWVAVLRVVIGAALSSRER